MIRTITLDDAQTLLRYYAQNHPVHQALLTHADQLSGVYSGGKLRAVWTHWIDELHPALLTFAVALAQDVTDCSRVGMQVLTEVLAAASDLRGVTFTDTVPASEFGQWLLTQNFRAVMQTTVTQLQLQDLRLPAVALAKGSELLNAREVLRDDQRAQQFLNLTWQQVDDMQRAVPIEDYDEDKWSHALLDGLLTKAPLVLWRADSIQAYGLLRRNADGELFLAWQWAADLAAMRQFLPAIVNFAQSTGAAVLNGVFTTSSQSDLLVWDLLPWQAAPTRNTLLRMNVGLDEPAQGMVTANAD
jgi:hypothetical protein